MFIAAVAIPKTAAAASWRRVHPRQNAPEKASTARAAPMTRIHATVCGATRSKRRMAIVAPTYCETAERTKSPSGDAVSRKRPTGPPRGGPARRSVLRRVPGGHVRHSKRSGSVRQISCHSGWKLNQPAKCPPVWAAV